MDVEPRAAGCAPALELRLVLEPGEPIRGRIEAMGACPVHFRGWMDLIAAINRLREARR